MTLDRWVSASEVRVLSDMIRLVFPKEDWRDPLASVFDNVSEEDKRVPRSLMISNGMACLE